MPGRRAGPHAGGPPGRPGGPPVPLCIPPEVLHGRPAAGGPGRCYRLPMPMLPPPIAVLLPNTLTASVAAQNGPVLPKPAG